MSRRIHRFKHAACAGLAFASLALSASGWAVTECTGRVIRVWTGDNGSMWVIMDTSVAWYLYAADPNFKNILANATTALVAGLPISVRFQADGVTCSGGGARGDVAGMWLIGS